MSYQVLTIWHKFETPNSGQEQVFTEGCLREENQYVVKGESQSLLGLRDGKALGIISLNPDGQFKQEKVNRVTKTKKFEAVVEGEVSGGQTQKEIDQIMEETAARHDGVFKGLGRAKVELLSGRFKSGGEEAAQLQKHPSSQHWQDSC